MTKVEVSWVVRYEHQKGYYVIDLVSGKDYKCHAGETVYFPDRKSANTRRTELNAG